MATIINNENFRQLIRDYFENPNGLPEDLRGLALNDWIVTGVTNMRYAFMHQERFNEPINRWIVSQVENMEGMFSHCLYFNQDLSAWDVSNVKNMNFMFNRCTKFDSRLDWGDRVRDVQQMNNMFTDCMLLGQKGVSNGLENWITTENLTSTEYMFWNCINFNENIGGWNVSNVRNMSGMFLDCKKFNQDLNRWIVNDVQRMDYMFYGCRSFNKPLNNWNVSHVENMRNMFAGCIKFNQNLSTWQINNTAIITDMFLGCNIELDNQPPLIAGSLLRKRRNIANAKNVSFVARKGNTYLPTDLERKIQSYIVYPTGGRKSRKNKNKKNKKKSRKNNKKKSRRPRK